MTDDPFARGAAGPLGRGGQALLAEDIAGLLDVAGRLHEGRFALHHACARLLTELAHHLCSNVCHMFSVAFQKIRGPRRSGPLDVLGRVVR